MARDMFAGVVRFFNKAGKPWIAVEAPLDHAAPVPTSKGPDVLLIKSTKGFELADTEEYGQVAVTLGVTVLKEEYARVTGKANKKSGKGGSNGGRLSKKDMETLIKGILEKLSDDS